MICKIFVPVRGDGKGDNVLAHAALLAHRFSAHIVVSFCRARPQDMLPYGVAVPAGMREQLMEQAIGLADAEEAKLKANFEQLCKELVIIVTDEPTRGKPSASWVARSGRQVDVIKQYGRLADLICVAQPDRDRNLGANTLKTALFNTGTPVVMCPPREKPLTTGDTSLLGNTVTIAWNGSTEASRAVALSNDLILSASKVMILATEDQHNHGASAEDLQDYLKIRGCEADVHRFTPQGKIGDELLSQSQSLGADMMIMGAYGNSHERETIFGGDTQSVVDKTTLPIVLVH